MNNFSELVQFTSILNKNKISYWLDSGTLLGVVREGNIIKNDTDIDIGIWSYNNDQIKVCVSEMERLGYKCRKQLFNNQIIKWIFLPDVKDDSKLRIDLHVFKENNNMAYSYSYRLKKKERTGGIIKYILSSFRNRLYLLIRKMIRKYGKTESISAFYSKPLIELKVWWIPKKYFLNTEKDVNMFFIPENAKEYLTFRYGEWEKPNKNWNFWDQDGGLREVEVLNRG